MSSQLSFFFDEEPSELSSSYGKSFVSIADAADMLGVSTATVRNWLRTGVLSSSARGGVSCGSIEDFKKNRQTNRLTTRANKSRKSEHNHEFLSAQIAERLENEPFDESIVDVYEQSLSESYRNKEGIYYTSQDIVDDMLRSIVVSDSTTFLDPCCGCGNYIIGAIDRGVKVENVYGFDTDANAVEITKRRIFAKTGIEAKNIVCADFLSVAKRLDTTFDLVYSNPPWGKKLAKSEKTRFAKMYGCGDSTDTCSLFVFAALKLLSNDGHLGFLLPEAVLNIAAFQSLRQTLLCVTSLEEIKDYGKPFAGVLTKAFSVIIRNTRPSVDSEVTCIINDNVYARKQSSFYSNPKKILNVWATQDEQDVIERLMQIPHKSLEHNAEWGIGIVTGDNKSKCKTYSAEGLVPIFRGQDITREGLQTPALFIDPNLSGCQQVAPMSLYYADEKLIYRFISNKLIFYCDTDKHLVLNSANVLVLKDTMPVSSRQLASLFNSEVLNWCFSKIFNTHKILRSDLETLPVYYNAYQNDTFDEPLFLQQNDIENTNGTYRIKR